MHLHSLLSRCWLQLAVVFGLFLSVFAGFSARLSAAEKVTVSPLTATLDQPEASLQLLVSQAAEAGRTVDLTRQAKYRSENEKIARVDDLGLVTPVADGETGIAVEHVGGSSRVVVTVT